MKEKGIENMTRTLTTCTRWAAVVMAAANGISRDPEARRDRGMSTAEYAVGIMAACTFALVLLGVAKSDAVKNAITGIVQRALGSAG